MVGMKGFFPGLQEIEEEIEGLRTGITDELSVVADDIAGAESTLKQGGDLNAAMDQMQRAEKRLRGMIERLSVSED